MHGECCESEEDLNGEWEGGGEGGRASQERSRRCCTDQTHGHSNLSLVTRRYTPGPPPLPCPAPPPFPALFPSFLLYPHPLIPSVPLPHFISLPLLSSLPRLLPLLPSPSLSARPTPHVQFFSIDALYSLYFFSLLTPFLDRVIAC